MLFKLINVLFLVCGCKGSMDTFHRLAVDYPSKFKLHRGLTAARVIPDQYIVVMNSNRSHVSTQGTSRRLSPSLKTTKSASEVNPLLSTLLDGTLDNNREGDFRVMVNNVYTQIFNGFSATLSPLAARFVLDDPNVASVEPNTLASIADVQRNPPWNLDRVDQSNSQLDNVFNTGSLNGEGVSIYILDTGINANHNDFVGRIQRSVDFVKDGNGPRDCNGHGTHCASTAAGTRWGVAKKALLNSVRVLGCNGSGSWSGILSGLDWSVQQITRRGQTGVISMSLGGQRSSILDRAVASAVRQGAVVVVAAGNEDSNACNSSPANEPLAITVGATTQRDARASFSNFGTCVDIFAPGVSIRAASHLSDTGTTLLSGTSMACPHVSGAAALELQKLRRNGRPTTPAIVDDQLIRSATRGVLSNLRGGPNLLLRIPRSDTSPNPNPSPILPTPGNRPPPTCRTIDFTPCVFPFVFRGVEYTTCTTDHDPNGDLWCSTRTDPNTNKHLAGFWGVCDMKSCEPVCTMQTKNGKNCAFPFIYKNVVHQQCTTVDDPLNKPWCSTKVSANKQHISGSGNWGHCAMNCPPDENQPMPMPTPRPPRPTPRQSRPPPRPTPPQPAPQPAPVPPIDCELLDAINDVRVLNQLPPLVMDIRLYLAAKKHGLDMGERNYFSHVSPTGSTPAERVSNEGYKWRSVAENIAAGYQTVEDVVNGWINSDGHFRNIKCTQCTRTGIAKVVVPNSQWTNYYVQVFASGDDDPNRVVPCQDPNPIFPIPRPVPPTLLPTRFPTLRPTNMRPPPPTTFPTNRPTTAQPTPFPTRSSTPVPTIVIPPTSNPTSRPFPTTSPNTNRNEDVPQQDDDTLDNVDNTCRTLPAVGRDAESCVFPFVYKSVLYSSCTVIDHNRPWCATATNQFGQFINDAWGVCNLDRCPIDNNEICQLQTMDAAWTNRETRLLSVGSSFTVLNTDQNLIYDNNTNTTNAIPATTTKKKWSTLLILTICSVVCNVLLLVYTLHKHYTPKKKTSLTPPITTNTVPTRETIAPICSSASL